MKRKLRLGMVGGGPGAFIGDVHRKAACFDGGVELVAGCFSRSAEGSRAMAESLYLDPARGYGSYQEMVEKESALPVGERIDLVSVVTPNVSHYEIASAFLAASFHVVVDKPMTFNVSEAERLAEQVAGGDTVFAVTYNYTGYPMVKLARDLVAQGDVGRVLKVVVQYPQGWLIEPLEKLGAKQAEWRTDPARAGGAGAMGDIGTHAENLVSYITGLKITELCAELSTMVDGRSLDDDGNCLLRFDNGARGAMLISQIAVGELNGLKISVHGEQASLAWLQEQPNELEYVARDGQVRIFRRGTDIVGERSPAAARATRLPSGHPEGFYEAFANVYRNVTDTIRARAAGREPTALELDFPGVAEGLRGMQFVEAVVRSKGNWTALSG